MNSIYLPSADKIRFETLDGLRGIAAICVVIMHITLWFASKPLLSGASLAVDFFFCLSGFVIAYSYMNRLRDTREFFLFLISRTIRLYPLILASFGIGIIYNVFRIYFHLDFIHYSLHDVFGTWLLNLFLIPVYSSFSEADSFFPLNPIVWSLFFEITANLVFAALLAFGGRRRLFLASTVIVILSLAFCVDKNTLEAGFDIQTFTIGFPRIGISFFLGVFIYEVWRRGYLKQLGGQSICVLGAILTGCFIGNSMLANHKIYYELFCAAAIFPMMVLSGSRHQPTGINKSACKILGDLSYPLYLLHHPVIFIFVGAMKRVPIFHGSSDPILLTLAFLFSLLAAWLMLKLYDEPVRSWLKRGYR